MFLVLDSVKSLLAGYESIFGKWTVTDHCFLIIACYLGLFHFTCDVRRLWQLQILFVFIISTNRTLMLCLKKQNILWRNRPRIILNMTKVNPLTPVPPTPPMTKEKEKKQRQKIFKKWKAWITDVYEDVCRSLSPPKSLNAWAKVAKHNASGKKGMLSCCKCLYE